MGHNWFPLSKCSIGGGFLSNDSVLYLIVQLLINALVLTILCRFLKSKSLQFVVIFLSIEVY